MNKQSITFKADEQELIKTGGINNYASNIVAYIEATFELGENWTGYDSVRAVWSNDYLTDISTVLDPNGRCIVPTEVLTDTGNVTVNLVGSISVDDELTDRLTTYPCKALIVDEDAKVEGDETESITPSQFEQFVEIVHDEVEQVTGMSAEAETLPAGSDATASYSDGVLSLGIPRGDKGEQGEQGETGHTGEPAGFGNVTASVDNTVGTPSVVVNTSGPDTAKEFDFEFHNLKGDKGDTGETGATGNGIASTVLNPDYTLTITFTDGTSYTTPSIRGAKGDTGNTGATGNGIQSTVLNADYTLTITFTDGTSYTTPSIRGEQGPAGPVSDVTVNGTSVVDQNGIAKILMPELIKTVNGNPIVLDDAFGEVKKLDVELLPIQDLHGYSKPWAGGAGTNKFNWDRTAGTPNPTSTNVSPRVMDTEHYFVGMTRNNYYSPSLVKSFDITNGTITIETSSGGYGIAFPVKAQAGTQYTVSFTNTENGKIMLGYYDASWNYLSDYDSIATSYTVTTPADTAYISVVIAPKTHGVGNPATVKDIQIELGSTATTYEPYANICPITGHDSVTVTDTGVNQWDEEWELGGISELTGQNFASTSAIRDINYIRVYPNTSYYYHCGVAGLKFRICYYDANKNFISSLAQTDINALYTTPNNAYYIRFAMRNTYGTTYNNDISINYPSTDTAYHAYHGQPKTVTLPHTVYGAGVGVTSGEGTETRGFVVLDGTENGWTKYGSASVYNNNLAVGTLPTTGAKINGTSSHIATLAGGALDDSVVVHVNAGRGLQFKDVMTKWGVADNEVTTWKAFLAQQYANGTPIQICTELATPTDLQTTPTDITLYNGDNVISSDGDMELTYVQDMAIVIEKLENLL